MKEINSYIIEKLKINKDSKTEKIKPDITDIEFIRDIFISTFIECLRNKNYKENSVFRKIIYLSKIDIEYVIKLLNNLFNYDYEYNIVSREEIYDFIKKNINKITSLINFFTIRVDDYILNGHDLYDKYLDIIDKKVEY